KNVNTTMYIPPCSYYMESGQNHGLLSCNLCKLFLPKELKTRGGMVFLNGVQKELLTKHPELKEPLQRCFADADPNLTDEQVDEQLRKTINIVDSIFFLGGDETLSTLFFAPRCLIYPLSCNRYSR